MKIKYWTNFSKRKNSTKQPLDAQAIEVDIHLKDNCSIINPVIETTSLPINANYFYIDDFKRYYFLDNTERTSNTIKNMAAEVDVLATYKSQIGSTSAMIAYSSTGWDQWKIDSRLPVKVTKTLDDNSNSPAAFDYSGTFILTVVNDQSNTGMTAQYAITASSLRAMAVDLFNNSGLITELKEYLAAAWDSIVCCKWIPFSTSDAPGSLVQVKLGKSNVNANGYLLSNPCYKSYPCTISIPWTYTDFRKASPFTSLAAWLPGYGLIELNPSDLVGLSSIKFDFRVDWSCGDVCCQIKDPVDGTVFQSIEYNVAVDVPLSNYTIDVAGIVSNTTSLVGGAVGTMASAPMAVATGNVAQLASGFSNLAANGVNSILAANKREVSFKGGIGGRATISEGLDVVIYSFSQDTEDPNDVNYIAKIGRPVGVVGTISSHSGYVQCDGASCDMPGTAIEKDRVNAYLNSGFFYE